MSNLIPVHHLGLGPLRHYERRDRASWGHEHAHGWRRVKNYNRNLTRRKAQAAKRNESYDEAT